MWAFYRQAWFIHRINSFHGVLFCLNHLILRRVHMALSDLPENSSEPRTKCVHKNMEPSLSLEKLIFSKAYCFIHLRKKIFFFYLVSLLSL